MILLWQGGIRADELWLIDQLFTYIPTHLISAWCCPTRQHPCVGVPGCVYYHEIKSCRPEVEVEK